MVVRHEPRNAVDAPIAHAPPLDPAIVEAKLAELLDRADALLGRRLSRANLTLLKRAASVIARAMLDSRPINTVQGLRVRIAPAGAPQPEDGGIPRMGIGNDTVRELLSDDVADVIEVAIRLGWCGGDFHEPTALTVFSTYGQAGRDSHALAVQNSMLPLIGIGIGSFDSFVITKLVELVTGTHHDPEAVFHDPDAIAEILKLWEFASVADMPLLNFAQTFELLVASDALQRERFKRAASDDEIARAFPSDVVVQRLPRGPYAKRHRTPAGEIMAKDHPEMAVILDRYGYRGVLTFAEEVVGPTQLKPELARISDLSHPRIRPVAGEELRSFQDERSITVDLWDVDHYGIIGFDAAGVCRRRVARHARFDDRVTVFETIGFDDSTIHEAVVLAEYATANELRKTCINATIDDRVQPGMLPATHPETRSGLRRLGLLSSAVTVALRRRAQAAT